jgi:cysteine sulfinate desulfinase/cysteine desulfurase-like protein
MWKRFLGVHKKHFSHFFVNDQNKHQRSGTAVVAGIITNNNQAELSRQRLSSIHRRLVRVQKRLLIAIMFHARLGQ